MTRGEVRGGGRKPYKQKGSGNARRGSKRSPLMPGGGISFGPKPRDWSASMNKKERKLACATALHSAAGDMLVCADFSDMAEVKTATLLGALSAMGVDAKVGAAQQGGRADGQRSSNSSLLCVLRTGPDVLSMALHLACRAAAGAGESDRLCTVWRAAA